MKIITASPVPASIYYNEKTVCNFNGNNKLKRCITNDTILGDYTIVFDMISLEEERNTHIVNVNNGADRFGVEALITKKKDNTSRTIDIQQGDLLSSPVQLVLNFTEYDICVKEFNGFTKVFPRVVNNKLSSAFDGKILFISIYSFNRESIINEIYGVTNYYRSNNKNSDGVNKELNDVFDFIKQKQNELIDTSSYSDFNNGVDNKDKLSTIKVCTLLVLNSDEFKSIDKNNEIANTIYLTSKNILVSIKPIDQLEDHPYIDFMYNLNRNNYDLIKDNSAICYIVDNDNRLGPRYFNFVGRSFKINSIKDKTLEDGLYIKYNDCRIFASMQDLLDNKISYIYSSKEEAEIGADVNRRYQEELSRLEFERKSELSKLQKELDTTVSENKRLLSEIETKKTIIKNELELKHIEETNRLNKELSEFKKKEEERKIEIDRLEKELDYTKSRLKHEFDVVGLNRKSIYEDKRYSQDYTIETIKTIGIIVSLALSSLVLYNKYKGK